MKTTFKSSDAPQKEVSESIIRLTGSLTEVVREAQAVVDVAMVTYQKQENESALGVLDLLDTQLGRIGDRVKEIRDEFELSPPEKDGGIENSDTLIKPQQGLTHYVLCLTGPNGTADPFEGMTGLHPTIEECVAEFRRNDPDRDLAEVHVMRQTYYNEGPVEEALRRQDRQAPPVNADRNGSGPVMQMFSVERRLSRIHAVVRTLTALASHENSLPPTIHVTEALGLLDEQLAAALDELSEALMRMRSEALTDQEDMLNGVKAYVGNTEDGQ